MFCKNCGASIPDGSRFCPECGTAFDAASDAGTQGAGFSQEQSGQSTYQEPVYQQPVYQQAQPQWQPQPQYQQPKTTPDGKPLRSNGFAITGLILAILTVFLFWIPFFGILLGIAAIIFSALGIRTEMKAMGITALVISILFLLAALFMTVFTVLLVNTAFGGYGNSSNLNDLIRFFEQFGYRMD